MAVGFWKNRYTWCEKHDDGGEKYYEWNEKQVRCCEKHDVGREKYLRGHEIDYV